MLGYVTSIVDLNNNGKLDLAGLGPLVPNGTYYTKIYERENDTTYNGVYIGHDVNTDFLEWSGDSDGDGLGETLVSRPFDEGRVPTRKFFLYESRDSLSYPDTTNVIWTYIKGSYTFAPVYCKDLDQDGRKEFIFVDGDSGWVIKIFEAVGDNAYFLANDSIRFLGNAGVSNLSFGDLDGDGFQEIMLGRQNGEIRVVENTGDDTYAFTWSGDTEVSNSYASAFLGDSDRDGRNEFVVGGNDPGVYHLLSVLESSGDNSCTKIWETTIYYFPFGIQTIKAGDIDGDGTIEFTFANSSDSVWIFKALGENQFGCLLRINAGSSLEISDLNTNGKTEIMYGFDFNTPDPSQQISEYDSLLTSIPLDPPSSIPSTAALLQNYPNPFNQSTTITIQLPVQSEVSLAVYDMLGRKIRTLITGFMSPGLFTVRWDGRDANHKELATGIYFVRFDFGHRFLIVSAQLLR
jgi:hypothetical protein